MRAIALVVALFSATVGSAQSVDLEVIVETHVLPGYLALARETENLRATAVEDCAPESPALRTAYGLAFDAWVSVSHLRFGPSEAEDRAFALAFWPDPRGSTPKSLGTLIREQDPVIEAPDDFATVSVAARGFYALEFLLFDAQLGPAAATEYHCDLIRAVTVDIAANAMDIYEGWVDGYGALLSSPGNDTYRNRDEAARQLFTALTTGLEFTGETRLGRPLGTFDRPRPNRAEARRSERSLRHVVLSLSATRQLAALITDQDPATDRLFEIALDRAASLGDPIFAGVASPGSRIRVEALKQDVTNIREHLALEIGPSLGVSAGFNSLDGD